METPSPSEYANRRNKWYEALRSGEYIGTYGRLRKEFPVLTHRGDTITAVGYCCLGIACDLWSRLNDTHADWMPSPFASGEDNCWYTFPDPEGERADTYPPSSVWEWFGLLGMDAPTANNQAITVAGVETTHKSLAEVNDSNEYSMSQIADIIEENEGILFHPDTLAPPDMRYNASFSWGIEVHGTTVDEAFQQAQDYLLTNYSSVEEFLKTNLMLINTGEEVTQ